MNYPISNFNDNKVTLEQELTERTVAYRDLTHLEMQHMIQKHRKFYWYFKYQPYMLVVLIIFEILVIYFSFVVYEPNRLTFYALIIPPIIFYSGYKKEKQYFADISLPVVKTVGTLKTYVIRRRRSTERYFEVENIKFDSSNNDGSIVNLILNTFGENKSSSPIRIEYSPYSKLIWEIKKRNLRGWETVYDVIPEKFDNEPIRLILPLDQKMPLVVGAHKH